MTHNNERRLHYRKTALDTSVVVDLIVAALTFEWLLTKQRPLTSLTARDVAWKTNFNAI
jgi:hypothetical protein